MTDPPIISNTLPPVEGVDAAYQAWGCTCAPVAIAAALGRSLDDVKPAVSPGGRFRGYMGIRDIRSALGRLGVKPVRTWSKPVGPTDVFGIESALASVTAGTCGAPLIIMLRFCGPWDSVPRAAATYRHAAAYRRVFVGDPDHWAQRARGPGWVCDVNNWTELSDRAHWLPTWTWRNTCLVHLLPKRGDGRVAVDWIAQVGEPS